MKTEGKMVSIIVPVHNVEATLDYCIPSILNQSYASFELLLIENGSTDESEKKCREYATGDRRIRVFSLEEGKGPSPARNFGLDKAEGDYIAFVDADDFLERDYLRYLVDALERTGADVSACGINDAWQQSDGSFRKQPRTLFSDYQATKVFSNSDIFEKVFFANATLWNKLYKKQCLGLTRFQTQMTYGEDVDFLTEVFLSIHTVAAISYCGYNYVRAREGSIVTAKVNPSSLEFLANIRAVYHKLCAAGYAHIGIYRLQIAVCEVWEKIPDFSEPKYQCYIRACKETLREPTIAERLRFFFSRRVPLKKKLIYLDRLCLQLQRRLSQRKVSHFGDA